MPTATRVTIEVEKPDGRWIAEIPALPGVLAYGATREETIARAKDLALRVLAERLEHGEATGELDGLFPACSPADDPIKSPFVGQAFQGV